MINGIEAANTRTPRFLYETMLPIRTYILKVDCRLELFEVSDLTTKCPYKVRHYLITVSIGTTKDILSGRSKLLQR